MCKHFELEFRKNRIVREKIGVIRVAGWQIMILEDPKIVEEYERECIFQFLSINFHFGKHIEFRL